MNQRIVGVAMGISLIIVGGVFLPMLRFVVPEHEFALSNTWLFQACLIMEGLFAIALFGRWTPYAANPQRTGQLNLSQQADGDVALDWIGTWLLLAVTVIAAGLRLYRLDTDLWLDEIATAQLSGQSTISLLTTFTTTNNHFFNSLLVKLSVATFGESDWAVRLPAVIFGTAAIPALYWLARFALSRWLSIASAVLLATSYHHIFFSQNARGYTAYLLFSLLSTALLIRALRTDRRQDWTLFVLATALNFFSLIHALFVFAAHAFASACVLVAVKRAGVSPMHLFKRMIVVFGVSGLIGVQIYAFVVVKAFNWIGTMYAKKLSGYEAFSLDFVQEFLRGVSAGFGGWTHVLVPIAMLVGLVGFIALLRRNWILAVSLFLPGLLTLAFFILKGLTISPRMFLLWIIVTILSAVLGTHVIFVAIESRILRDFRYSKWLSATLISLIIIASLTSLAFYYRTPKQNYRDTIAYVEEMRDSDDIVVVILYAETGIRYYLRLVRSRDDKTYVFLSSLAKFEEIASKYGRRNMILIITFPRALRLVLPTLYERIVRDWQVETVFPATIGDGALSVWRSY